MTGIFKLFLELKSDFQSVILTRKRSDCLEGGIVSIRSELSDKVEQFVCLEKKLESAGIDLSGGSDAGRSEALSVFEIDGGAIL
jgi:hypothetical protein